MNKNDLLARIAALVSTLNEEPGGMAPASLLYLALGMDMRSYSVVSDLAAQAGLVEKTSQTLTITPKGRELARKMDALMARKNPRIYTYTVTGKGSFPLDMLRYDVASPADAKSAALIKASSRRARAFFGYPEIYCYSVRLVSAYEPTLGRWESFGWEVSDVSSARTAKNNPRSTGYVAAKIRAHTRAKQNSYKVTTPFGTRTEP